MNDSESRSGESVRASVEAERKRLREQLEEIRGKYGPGQAPTDEEMRTLSDKVRGFVDSTPPELLWPEGVEPPADGTLFGVLRTPEEMAVARAEEAVKAMGWPECSPSDRFETELLHARHEELGVAIGVWGHESDPRPDAPFLCAVSEGEKALWVLGVPAPADVHGLLVRHARIAVPIDLGIGHYVLDLQTGEIIVEREAQKLLADPKRAARERVAREALAAHDIREAYRELGTKGWELYDPEYAVGHVYDAGGRRFEVIARVCVSGDYETVLLNLAAHYPDSFRPVWVLALQGVVAQDHVITESYGGRSGLLVPLGSLGSDGAPTPREAARLLNERGDAE